MTQQLLPIYDIVDDLVTTFTTASRLILTAPTGSGKSTQVPQILLDRGLLGTGEVVVLQPRRLAARLLAARVAEERGVPLGTEVGYQVRLEAQVSAATRIRYVTEGILLRRLLTSPHLDGVSAILFDEFHERHVYGDITLACTRMLQDTKRPDLKLNEHHPEHGMNTPAPREPSPPAETRNFLFAIRLYWDSCGRQRPLHDLFERPYLVEGEAACSLIRRLRNEHLAVLHGLELE